MVRWGRGEKVRGEQYKQELGRQEEKKGGGFKRMAPSLITHQPYGEILHKPRRGTKEDRPNTKLRVFMLPVRQFLSCPCWFPPGHPSYHRDGLVVHHPDPALTPRLVSEHQPSISGSHHTYIPLPVPHRHRQTYPAKKTL